MASAPCIRICACPSTECIFICASATRNVRLQCASPSGTIKSGMQLCLFNFTQIYARILATSLQQPGKLWPCHTQRDLKHFTLVKASDWGFRGGFWGRFGRRTLEITLLLKLLLHPVHFGAKCPTRSVHKPQSVSFMANFYSRLPMKPFSFRPPENYRV